MLGAAIGVVLPSNRDIGGALGFWVAAGMTGFVAIVIVLRHRVLGRSEHTVTHEGPVTKPMINPSERMQ